eukprot:7073093-Prymnesium_polylepis.1
MWDKEAWGEKIKMWDKETWGEKIKTFHYAQRRKGALSTGISSYGTITTLIDDLYHIDIVLSKPNANLNTTSVIGYKFEQTEKRVLILFSSVKMAMDMVEEFGD